MFGGPEQGGERRPAGASTMGTVRSAVIGAVRAVPLAVVLVHLLVAGAIVTVAPSSGLLSAVGRMLAIDQGAWLLLVPAVVALFWALRPPTDATVAAWLQRRDLPAQLAPHAAREIERVRRWRVVPTLAVWLLGTARGTAYNLAIAEVGAASRAADDLLAAVNPDGLAGTLVPVLAAYLFGVVAGELTRPVPAADDAPAARLEVRRPASYLVPWARRVPWLAGGVLLLLIAVRAAVVPDADAWSGLSTASLLVTLVTALALGLALQRWVVRRPQRITDEAALAFDDVGRSSTAHAIAGAVAVALLAMGNEVLSDIWNATLDGPRFMPWALIPVGLALMAGVFGIWPRYGSAHPGTRPAERGQPT